ncbi:MAG: M48 family metallopeptidase [Phycisphaerae bacterium]|nr:M48 family metallopeptidase [Phycisphaerae bacterium]MDD5381790.1 M48 family metallopeptidase [Phycisphaerae bacterium]
MWELIRANKRNSVILMALMVVVLLLLGYVIGSIFDPAGGFLMPRQQMQSPRVIQTNYAGFWGMAFAATLWFILMIVSFSSGDHILLNASNAKLVTHDEYPQLFNVVEEMKIAAGLPAIPKVYLIPDPAPNAFATGRSPKSASVAVTAGLLGRLNRDQLQGVIAHEMSHILHRDILYVTLAGIMLGSIVLISQVFLRSMFYSSMGSRRRYSSGGKNAGQAQLIMLVIAIIAAIVAPIMAYLLYFALSRKREYLADAGAARLTRYPEGLAGALEKIAGDPSPQLAAANKVTAPMYIVNPFKKARSMKLSDLTSTHPPISERIKILRSMSSGVSFKDYSDSYTRITHHKTIVPAAALTKEDIALRQAGAEAKDKQRTEQMRQVGDIMRKINQFVFLTCLCGLKLKIPPNFKSDKVQCPRCKRIIDLPAK